MRAANAPGALVRTRSIAPEQPEQVIFCSSHDMVSFIGTA